MAENSAIEWTTHTFNPWIGCTKVSPACDHCYAEAQDHRFGGNHWGPHAPRRRTSAANWKKPEKWSREAEASGIRPRVFCASMADVFDNHRSITSGWHGNLWALIDRTPNLDWLLLTKRPQNIKKMLPESYGMPEWGDGWPNVWLGTTVENQEEADRRIPHLLKIPAAVRFLSCEPLLGQVILSRHPVEGIGGTTDHVDYLRGQRVPEYSCRAHLSQETPGIDWVITGGESGPGARPTHPDWLRSLRDQCAAADVPFFFKQWGEWATAKGIPGHLPIDHVFDDGYQMIRAGKKATGRALDGVIHDGYPAAQSALQNAGGV